MADETPPAASSAGGTPPVTPPPAGGTPPPAWHEGKVDAETVGFWQRKNLDFSDPAKLATELTKQYSGAEKLIGVPPEELIRMPRPNAAEADVRAYLTRIGVPAEPKDYDLSQIKFADGSELDQGFSDTIRALFHAGRVTKDRAGEIVQGLVKYMDGRDTAEAAELAATTQREREALDKNWGTNKARNLLVAQDALDKIGRAAGLTPDQIKSGWDALSRVGGIGASHAMEMLRILGSRMGEGNFVDGRAGGGDPAMLSRESARQEIESLKKDAAFRQRLLNGDVTEQRRWNNLHQAAYGAAA